jgi:hypothetical protein
VLPWWEGADEAQSRYSFSNLIRYGITKKIREATPRLAKECSRYNREDYLQGSEILLYLQIIKFVPIKIVTLNQRRLGEQP